MSYLFMPYLRLLRYLPIGFCSFGITVFVMRVSVWSDASSGKGGRRRELKLAAEREILQNDIVHRIRRRLSLLG